MLQGIISKLYRDKGYGYVEGQRGYRFFEQSTLHGTTIEALKVGQPVEFKEGFGPAGPRVDYLSPLHNGLAKGSRRPVDRTDAPRF